MIPLLAVIAGLILLGFLLFLFNGLWIYAVWDRAKSNGRDSLPREYEIPRYYVRNLDGTLDYDTKWPGWDGWYFFAIPDARDIPLRMIRASLMTGLYGLEGIDNYERLQLKLSSLEAAEVLSLIPTAVRASAGIEKRNNLSQHYLPKASDLRMSADKLDITMSGADVSNDTGLLQYGRMAGSWPDYRLQNYNPEANISVDLRFHGENLIWWADVPGIFTYATCLGRFEGTITYHDGTQKPDPHDIPDLPENSETYPIRGAGGFEHGFARRLFSANRLFLPVRLLKYAIPSFRTIRYQYEVMIGDGGPRGGFMQASAFGVKVRNRGGLYLDGRYVPIDGIRIRYLNDPPPDEVAAHCPASPTTYYRKWVVEADTPEGLLTYTGSREWPPAPVAPSMTYYNFSYEGTYKGVAIRGRGYGEYVDI